MLLSLPPGNFGTLHYIGYGNTAIYTLNYEVDTLYETLLCTVRNSLTTADDWNSFLGNNSAVMVSTFYILTP